MGVLATARASAPLAAAALGGTSRIVASGCGESHCAESRGHCASPDDSRTASFSLEVLGGDTRMALLRMVNDLNPHASATRTPPRRFLRFFQRVRRRTLPAVAERKTPS